LQWPGISAVVPSLSSKLSLEGLVDTEVTLSPEQWALVASIGGGHAVGEVLNERGLGEFDGCKAVKELVGLGLVQVDRIDLPAEPALAAAPAAPEYDPAPPAEYDVPPAPEFHDEDQVANGWTEAELSNLSDVWNDETGQVESAPVEEDQPETGQPVNRGLLLKFLGSARS
jgi:hypothetical protein